MAALSRPIKRYAFLLCIIWTLLVSGSFLWSYSQQKRSVLEIAKHEAQIAFQKDTLYRKWASQNGGVFVPVTPETQPNPYLPSTIERTASTPSGKLLTLVNPAYMTRQVFALAAERGDIVQGHLTSLKPIRPENAPDQWETAALTLFETGAKEVSEVKTIEGLPYLRLMRPFIADQQCLKCHAAQGYKVDDIRGGISVSVPLRLLAATSDKIIAGTGIALGLIWLLGIGIIYFGTRKLLRVATALDDKTHQLENQINERKEVEKALLEADWKFRALFEKGPIGVAYHEMIYDAQGKPKDYLFLDANETYVELTGVDPRGKTVIEAFPGIEKDPFDWIGTFGHVAKTGESIRFEQYLQLNGRWYDCVGYQYKPDHFVAAFLNITKRKQVEVALKQRTKELEERSAELVRFNYTVSHDLKSPLVTVQSFLGFLEIDLATKDVERINRDIDYIRLAAKRMAQLLDELLEISQIGRVANPSVELTFYDLTQEVTALLAGPIVAGGVTIQVDATDIVLVGDRMRLLEIWQNLVENAIKYMGDQPQPSVTLGSEMQGDEVIFFVRDNGIGIDPRYAEKIFGLFEQLDRASEGSGLGLALVKRIVELNNGRIWVESGGEGQGSCFRFTLPAALRQGES